MRFSRWALALGVATAIGCGGGSSAPSQPSAAGAGPSATINIEGDAYRPGGSAGFSPGSVTVKVGTTVNWANMDQTTHTTTGDNGEWNGSMSGGGSFSRVFTAPGSYDYHCTIHPSMQGTIIVQ